MAGSDLVALRSGLLEVEPPAGVARRSLHDAVLRGGIPADSGIGPLWHCEGGHDSLFLRSREGMSWRLQHCAGGACMMAAPDGLAVADGNARQRQRTADKARRRHHFRRPREGISLVAIAVMWLRYRICYFRMKTLSRKLMETRITNRRLVIVNEAARADRISASLDVAHHAMVLVQYEPVVRLTGLPRIVQYSYSYDRPITYSIYAHDRTTRIIGKKPNYGIIGLRSLYICICFGIFREYVSHM